MRKLVFLLLLLVVGCVDAQTQTQPCPKQMYKITQGERVWYAKTFWSGDSHVCFRNNDREIRVYGNFTIEEVEGTE
jgi:hypothetical protein